MIWQSCENQRAIILNETMAEQLCSYLATKENELCIQLLKATKDFTEMPPQLSNPNTENLKLHDTLDDIGRRLHRLSSMPQASIPLKEWRAAIRMINVAFWNYLEVIETSLTELFHQIDQIGFEFWTIDLSDAATQIKDELTHRLDDIIWGVRRFEKHLNDCYSKVVKSERNWHFFSSFWSKPLDPSIESTAKKCIKFLNFRYGKFVECYVGYLELYDDAEQPLKKIHNFRALSMLDGDIQEKYKQTCFLLNLWDLNNKARTLPRSETVRAVRSLSTHDSTFLLFKGYLSVIRSTIFDRSRLLKKPFGDILMTKQSKEVIIDQLGGLQNELHFLASNIDKYRTFLMQTKNNHRSKFNFSRWFGFKETSSSKPLLGLVRESEQLDTLCKQFKSSLLQEDFKESKLTPELEQEISQHLHEMGQPLASKVMMRRNAKIVLQCLQKIDELSSFYASDVEYISRTLCKLMRSDWKYHVLFDVPGFQQLFQTHINMTKPVEDRQHIQRYNAFKKLFQQLNHWIEKKDLVKHASDVDLEVNDTKALLQDFLAQVQQIELSKMSSGIIDKEALSVAMWQLLEYLHLFGNFFHSLQSSDPDQRQLRRRFLFVDQYFDAIEAVIQRTL